MSPLNITQPLGIWSIMATIRWFPIFPKWDIYQPLLTHAKNQWISGSANQSINEALNQGISDSMNQGFNESVNQWNNQSMNQWISEPLNLRINESVDQETVARRFEGKSRGNKNQSQKSGTVWKPRRKREARVNLWLGNLNPQCSEQSFEFET